MNITCGQWEPRNFSIILFDILSYVQISKIKSSQKLAVGWEKFSNAPALWLHQSRARQEAGDRGLLMPLSAAVPANESPAMKRREERRRVPLRHNSGYFHSQSPAKILFLGCVIPLWI